MPRANAIFYPATSGTSLTAAKKKFLLKSRVIDSVICAGYSKPKSASVFL